MRKKLIIVGAGGLGRVVYNVLANDAGFGEQYALAGFLDTRPDLRLPDDIAAPLLGSPLDYQVRPGEAFIPAVGDPGLRERLLAPLLAQGAEFATYSEQAFIGARTRIGAGTFITPGAVLSVDSEIGRCVYIDTYVVLGHDVTIGDHAMLGAMTFLAGGVRVGHGASIHPRATIAKDVSIGDGATVGIGSVVVNDVPAGVTVFGNPARIIFSK
ncbi:acetyltransferase [Pseudomonas paraeruginosa]|uniref:acetyltransferase n=1 Tax=Pseudomonas aeruginosa group TaxID=136841 RepID=UPI0005BDC5EB|nr:MULTISPECIES: acetyltransferase [Pseudomonas aeruginosa group]MDK2349144.1 acetyltransferase [Pseudomonas paraeruginosa]MEA8481136.1 acetyltransferase [Pseudomonas aeruginosa]